MTQPNFTRRHALKTGAALAGAGAFANLTMFAQAWAQTTQWQPEKGATLTLLRWKRFIQSEEDAFMALVAAYTKATGVEVKVLNESLDDVQPKASVAANTGQGPDIFWGLYSLPHLFPDKCVDVTDVADYLGKKYGGWVESAQIYGKSKGKWIDIPVAYNGNVINYRQSMIEKAGFKEVPKDTAGFLELMKAMKAKSTPGGFALGRASGDGNAWVHWALWSHGGNLVDKNDKVVINSPETVKALEYVKEMSNHFVTGTASWNDAFNNKAFLSGEVGLTNNGVSIYAAAKAGAAKGDAKMKEVMDDMNHALWPVGPVGRPTEFHIAYPMMVMKYSKFPKAAKSFIAFTMEAENYNKWLEGAVAYLTHPLNAYDANPVWSSDPKLTLVRDVAKRTLTAGGQGSVGERAAAALADFVVLDMFASVCTDRASIKDAISIAERQATRIYR
ncbi:ABC transporter substrate-binding protein [Piscinibacter sakaiensis]|uniref:ABC transporter substrate-binding protein n=1 Tax=Piscinibacter sakaiensis TaxID=1547922 RepID=UPI003AAEC575